MRVSRTVTVQKPLDEVFAYLADFTTTTEWDPGTVSTVRTAGDGARFVAPLMRPAFTRLGDEAGAGMAAALDRL